VQELTPELGQQLGIEGTKGVIVTRVEPDSPADEAGIRRRDVILEVNQRPVASVKDFRSALGETSKGALLLVRRGEAEIFVAVKAG
jgi:serine protease Do